MLATPGWTAYIKIAEGCDHPCSFCIIPQLRGKFRSRRFESVVAEAERLARSGVREITLIGQDTTCYGEDLGLKDGLPLLLERLALIEDLRWIRFLYAYPNKITRTAAGDHRRPRKDLLLHRRPLAACVAVGAEAHETRRRERSLSALDREDAPHHSRPDAAHVVHRRLPGRDGARLRRAVRVRARSPSSTGWASSDIRTRKAPPATARRKVPAREIERRRQQADADPEADQPSQEEERSSGAVDVLLEGPSDETDLLWEGRTAMHAPEIDGKVFVSDSARIFSR